MILQETWTLPLQLMSPCDKSITPIFYTQEEIQA